MFNVHTDLVHFKCIFHPIPALSNEVHPCIEQARSPELVVGFAANSLKVRKLSDLHAYFAFFFWAALLASART